MLLPPNGFQPAWIHMLLLWRRLWTGAMETEGEAAEEDKGHCHGALMRAAPIPAAPTDRLTALQMIAATTK